MRKPRGKLVALLAGAVVVVLVAVGATFWKDIYCRLCLDPRLVGRWAGQISVSTRSLDVLHTGHVFKFDKVGNVRSTRVRGIAFAHDIQPESIVSVGTYSIDGNSLDIAWPRGVWSKVYRIEEGTLTLFGSSGSEQTYRRVPDDS